MIDYDYENVEVYKLLNLNQELKVEVKNPSNKYDDVNCYDKAIEKLNEFKCYLNNPHECAENRATTDLMYGYIVKHYLEISNMQDRRKDCGLTEGYIRGQKKANLTPNPPPAPKPSGRIPSTHSKIITLTEGSIRGQIKGRQLTEGKTRHQIKKSTPKPSGGPPSPQSSGHSPSSRSRKNKGNEENLFLWIDASHHEEGGDEGDD